MARLTVQTEEPGAPFQIEEDEIRIGRAPDNQISFDDASVSGHHCTVRREDNRYYLKDNGSTNGTSLNGHAVKNEARLNAGDMISVGAVEVLFDGDEVENEEREATHAAVASPVTTSSRAMPSETNLAFSKKRDNKGLWVGIIIAGVIGALVALVWFVYTLLQSQAG